MYIYIKPGSFINNFQYLDLGYLGEPFCQGPTNESLIISTFGMDLSFNGEPFVNWSVW